MVKIVFISAAGVEEIIEAAAGVSLMENAVGNGIYAIRAVCGGNAYCGTCRVYVDEAWRAATGQAGEIEIPMLEASGDETPGVRLSCQMVVTAGFEGLVVRTPVSQE